MLEDIKIFFFQQQQVDDELSLSFNMCERSSKSYSLICLFHSNYVVKRSINYLSSLVQVHPINDIDIIVHTLICLSFHWTIQKLPSRKKLYHSCWPMINTFEDHRAYQSKINFRIKGLINQR